MAIEIAEPPGTPLRRWTPKRALLTPAAAEHAHGRAVAERCAALGVEVVELGQPADRPAR